MKDKIEAVWQKHKGIILHSALPFLAGLLVGLWVFG